MTLPTATPTTRPMNAEHNAAPALVVDRLTLDYGELRGVDDVSFAIERGTILCLLGASGSGKSSVLRLLAGLERPTSGRIMIDGAWSREMASSSSPSDAVSAWCSRTSRCSLTSLSRQCRLRDSWPRPGRRGEHCRRAADRRWIGGAREQLPAHAVRRRAAAGGIGPCPGAQATILLMDEPFSSLDSRLRDHLRQQTIDLLRRSGTTTFW